LLLGYFGLFFLAPSNRKQAATKKKKHLMISRVLHLGCHNRYNLNSYNFENPE